MEFKECSICAGKPGIPYLCSSCLHNRDIIEKLKKLIEEWRRSAIKYHNLGMKADHNPVQQEGLLCRSEVYNYCAGKLDKLYRKGGKPVEEVTICKYCVWYIPTDYDRGIPNCKCPEAPITNFIDGLKSAPLINIDGKCPFYQDRRQCP